MSGPRESASCQENNRGLKKCARKKEREKRNGWGHANLVEPNVFVKEYPCQWAKVLKTLDMAEMARLRHITRIFFYRGHPMFDPV